MLIKVSDILSYMLEQAPAHLAEDWDNIGLMCGNPHMEVQKILVALDVTGAVIEEALQTGCNLIIAHHPMIFKGLKQVITTSLEGEKLYRLIKNDIAVLALHTNLDVAEQGVNVCLAKALLLEGAQVLHPTYEIEYQKIEVYVPTTHEEAVRVAMCSVGAGVFGAYENCTFTQSGVGRFLPTSFANPFLGQAGRAEEVNEVKIEVVCEKSNVEAVLEGMKKVHPYETPAFYILNSQTPKKTLGLGMIGTLAQAMAQDDFLSMVKSKLKATGLRYAGARESIQTVAVAGGACAEFMEEAFTKGADVYITADLKYHDFLTAKEKGYFVIDGGHFETENMICVKIEEMIKKKYENIRIEISEKHDSAIAFLV